MNLGLEGKVALVTGSSEGIGFSTARRLLQEGAHVLICARRAQVLADAAAELRKTAPNAQLETMVADVSQEKNLRELFAFVERRFGRLDILVNNAGTAAAMSFENVTDALWRDDFELKVFGAIRAIRFALPLLQKQGGSVINLLNIGAKQPAANSLPSTVSRAAGLALTKALSKELGSKNIRINAVLIGLVKSAQHDRGWRAHGGDRDAYYDAQAKKRQVPLGRAGESDEAADLIAFLASDRAAYITGTAINFDGGASAVT